MSLSAVIVAYDSLAHLRCALPALLAELGDEDELIVVDNASRDGLARELPGLAPQARIVPLPENVGFAAGANRGVAAARGDLVVLLNPDSVVQPGWAEALREPWGGPWAAWMALVVLPGCAEINTSGGVLHFAGFGWAGQIGDPVVAAPSRPTDVGFLSGACLAIPRATFAEVGGFPEGFFMYCEDVDLSLKLRLRGKRVAVIPAAIVAHDYEFLRSTRKWRLLERNRLATVIRTYPGPLLFLVLPALIVSEVAVWGVSIRSGWVGMKALATLDLLRWSPRLRRERRLIQSQRTVGAGTFAATLTPELSSPYFGAIGRNRLVSGALTAYWKLVRLVLQPTSGGRER